MMPVFCLELHPCAIGSGKTLIMAHKTSMANSDRLSGASVSGQMDDVNI